MLSNVSLPHVNSNLSSYLCHKDVLCGKILAQPIIYWRENDRHCTWGCLEKKGKLTFLHLNNAVLSNIYGTEGKQGQRYTLLTSWLGKAVTGYWYGSPIKGKKKHQLLCLKEVLIPELPIALLNKATGCFSVSHYSIFVHECCRPYLLPGRASNKSLLCKINKRNCLSFKNP